MTTLAMLAMLAVLARLADKDRDGSAKGNARNPGGSGAVPRAVPDDVPVGGNG